MSDMPRVGESWSLKRTPSKVVSVLEVASDRYVFVHMPWAKETFQGKSMDTFLKQYEREE